MNTNYESALHIMHVLLSTQAQCFQYKWSSDFKIKEINEIHANLKNAEWFEPIDVNKLSKTEMQSLGFKPYDNKLMLIPLWLLPFMTTSFTGRCIMDKEVGRVVTSSMDNDVRAGCLAYGVEVENNND